MSEITIERRSFLLGAVLAPFAGGLAAAVEPKRSYTEFIISLAGGRDQFHVCLSEVGDVEEVTHGRGDRDRRFPMTETTRGGGWLLFQHCHGPHSASISFRVDDPNTIRVEYVMAKERLYS